ncbi:MAG: 50S ribosomal protein L35 [Candidatus Liptonbacteria bacterium]|nr:50S ribosomal protein L35 [Candidatus Liptonbacteria bacterium]
MNKTSKSVSKRIRITRTGKLIRRPMGVDHFRTRQSAKILRSGRKTRSLDYPRKKILNY